MKSQKFDKQQLKMCLGAANMTGKELSELLGITENSYYNMVRIGSTSTETLTKIAQILKVDISVLLPSAPNGDRAVDVWRTSQQINGGVDSFIRSMLALMAESAANNTQQIRFLHEQNEQIVDCVTQLTNAIKTNNEVMVSLLELLKNKRNEN